MQCWVAGFQIWYVQMIGEMLVSSKLHLTINVLLPYLLLPLLSLSASVPFKEIINSDDSANVLSWHRLPIHLHQLIPIYILLLQQCAIQHAVFKQRFVENFKFINPIPGSRYRQMNNQNLNISLLGCQSAQVTAQILCTTNWLIQVTVCDDLELWMGN